LAKLFSESLPLWLHHKILEEKTLIRIKPGSLLRILWCSQSGDHPENNLAKFGYILDMKIEKQNPSIFLATYRNLSLKSGDLELFSFENLSNLGHFFHEKSFV